MREMWMMAPVLFPVVSGGALWIWNPGKNKIHTAAAVLSLAEAVCSWLVILNCMGMELPLWSIGPGMELCPSLIYISEPTRLRRISYAVFCLKKKKYLIPTTVRTGNSVT